MIKILVISFTHLLGQLCLKKIKIDELDNAIFYPRCAKEKLLSDPKTIFNEARIYLDSEEEADRLFIRVSQIILQAEVQDKALLRKLEERNSYQELNRLLEKNGLKSLNFSCLEDLNDYNSYRVRELMSVHNPTINII